jgi:hypothetical protein
VSYNTTYNTTYYGLIPDVWNWYPSDGSTYVCIPVDLGVTIGDLDYNWMKIEWWSNYTGTWQIVETNHTGVYNGTYYKSFPEFDRYGTTYYWRVKITDQGGLINWTAYNEIQSFTTSPEPCIKEPIYDQPRRIYLFLGIFGLFGLIGLLAICCRRKYK